jgi:hypothetical protein
MKLCECIKSLDLTECIKEEELRMYPCLEDAVYTLKVHQDDEGVDYTDKDKLITILFRAVKELKNEIDTLKSGA